MTCGLVVEIFAHASVGARRHTSLPMVPVWGAEEVVGPRAQVLIVLAKLCCCQLQP